MKVTLYSTNCPKCFMLEKTLDKYKTLEINGLKMLPQYVWLDKKYVQKLIK